MRIMAFLHLDPNQLPRGDTEITEDAWNRLSAFRGKVETHHCNYWTAPEDLKTKVLVSLVEETHKYPGRGWVRYDGTSSHDLLRRLAELQDKYDYAQKELARLSAESEVRSSREDVIVSLRDELQIELDSRQTGVSAMTKTVTAADIFMAIGPLLASPIKRSSIALHIMHAVFGKGQIPADAKGDYQFWISNDSLSEIEVYFVALKLIVVNSHSAQSSIGPAHYLSSLVPYWQLTEDGAMILRQIKKRVTPSMSLSNAE
jgi:hypothetical protein